MLVAAAVVAASLSFSIVPASATAESDANFVNALYGDFLLPQPSDTTVSNYVAWLGAGGSRSSVVNSILGSADFATIWAYGVYDRYLNRAPTASEVSAAVSSASGGDYVAPEISALGSAEFYSASGGTASGFVTALFHMTLNRPPDQGGLAYWVNKVNTGTTRASVSTTFVRSTESANKRVGGVGTGAPCQYTGIEAADAIASGSYCLILDRPVDPSGLSYWGSQLAGSGQLPTLWKSLAASNEYYNGAQ